MGLGRGPRGEDVTVAAVTLWGRRIAAVSIGAGERTASFQYDPAFARSGVEVCADPDAAGRAAVPLPRLAHDAFSGLPGLLADALPDRWGTALIDAWLASQGRDARASTWSSGSATSGRAAPARSSSSPRTSPSPHPVPSLQVGALVRLAAEALADRAAFVAELADDPEEAAMQAILAVGTSAGGARPKAVIAYDDATGQIRSGQVAAGGGFRHWLLKFDGVADAGDHGLHDPQGWGASSTPTGGWRARPAWR